MNLTKKEVTIIKALVEEEIVVSRRMKSSVNLSSIMGQYNNSLSDIVFKLDVMEDCYQLI